MTGKVRKRIRVLFIVLVALAIAQLIWWVYLLVDQQSQIHDLIRTGESLAKKNRFLFMILTEASFWFAMWFFGLVAIYRTIKQERILYMAHRDFLSGITHELKTPITNIQLCIEGAKRASQDPNKQQIFLDRALTATDKLHKEIQNILRLNQQTQSSPRAMQQVSIQALLSEVILQIDDEHRDVLQILPYDQEVFKQTEEEGLSLILRSLIENSLKYSLIRKNSDPQHQVEIQISFNEKEICIRDNGIGIPKEELSSVTKDFYRGSQAKKLAIPGTGVGLSVAKQIAQRLDIDLEIYSEGANQGCEIRLVFKK